MKLEASSQLVRSKCLTSTGSKPLPSPHVFRPFLFSAAWPPLSKPHPRAVRTVWAQQRRGKLDWSLASCANWWMKSPLSLLWLDQPEDCLSASACILSIQTSELTREFDWIRHTVSAEQSSCGCLTMLVELAACLRIYFSLT